MAAALILEQVGVTEEDELQPGTQTACLHPVCSPLAASSVIGVSETKSSLSNSSIITLD